MRKRFLCMMLLLLTPGVACSTQTALPPLPTVTLKPVVPYPAASVIDTFAWCGKTTESLGIGSEHINTLGQVEFTTDLFGHTVTGIAYTLPDYSDSARSSSIYQIWLTDEIGSVQTALDGLNALYGEPYETYEEPYVASNGGVTFHYRYWTGEGTVALSYGANNDFYVFRYQASDEVPENIQ